MSDRKRKASGSEEPACMLCGRAEDDPNIFGRTFGQGWIRVHEFCLIFANIFYAETLSRDGTVGIPLDDITLKAKQANQKQCCVCGERGAAITCAESGCERSFHLPCAKDGQCVTQFFGQHRRPEQEDNDAYASFLQRHRRCDAIRCRHPEGRELAEEEGWSSKPQPPCFPRPWQLLLCSSCAAEGTHRECSYLNNTTATWECDRCAGLGTGKRQSATWLRAGARQGLAASAQGSFARVSLPQEGCQLLLTQGFILLTCPSPLTASSSNSELASSSTANQDGQGPSHSLQEHEDSCSSPTSQAASEPSYSSQLPELSCQSSELGTENRTIPSCLPENMVEQHQGCHRSRQTAAQSAECCSRTSTRRGTSESSRESPGAARRRRPRQRRTSRTRSRSPLQGRASSSQSRPRRRHGSRGTPAPRDQSSIRRSERLATLRSSRASPVPEQRGRSVHGAQALTESRYPARRRD
ncbi:PHD finger protein 7-like [Tympanuchus pallidicinctus]|uniref:PHD finger protein 7-like n=1 Tax=Tympanuchus pallidicinctus TaxID=109042 RepID=UPI0022872326|nr:PHD finger protein 7-like [Tympanuchus pallidicinctus]